MTSQLNVDTIVDKAGSGGTNVKVANTSTYVSDGGTKTQNTVQGLLKGWCHFTMVSSHAYRDSFNCGTLTDGGTGIATVNLTNPFSNDDWAGSMFTNAYNTTASFSNQYAGGFDNRTSSSVRLVAHNGSNAADAHLNDIHFAGDLA